MTHSAQEAYEKGHADGTSTAEQMRWRGTPIGNLLKGNRYNPDVNYRAAYDEGFRQAMFEAHRMEWTPPTRHVGLPQQSETFVLSRQLPQLLVEGPRYLTPSPVATSGVLKRVHEASLSVTSFFLLFFSSRF